MRWFTAVVLFALTLTLSAQTGSAPQTAAAPTIDDLISLKRVGSPALSPDGRMVAYTLRSTDWDDNSYETEIWIADVATGANRQLTNAPKSSTSPAWSPDGKRSWLKGPLCSNRIIAAAPATAKSSAR